MGTVFDQKLGKAYDIWCQSTEGRIVERCLPRLVKTLLEPFPGERILDVGCGSGNHLLTFAKLGLEGSGLDPSAALLEHSKQRLASGCRLHRGEAEDLPFEDNEFDLVSLINTLEFVENPLEALREAGRVASRRVLIVTFNSLSCFGAGARIKGFLGNRLFRAARLFSLMELKSLAESAYGNAPTAWRSVRGPRPLAHSLLNIEGDSASLAKSPFGCILALGVTMKYVVKADAIGIKTKLKEPRLTLVSPTSVGPLKRNRGGNRNEGSVSVRTG